MFPNLSKAYPMNEVRMFQQRQLGQLSQLSQTRNVTELNGFIPPMAQLSQVLHNASWQGARTIVAWAPGRGQAIAPTMDELRRPLHRGHSRGDGLSSPSSGCCLVRQDMRSLQQSH